MASMGHETFFFFFFFFFCYGVNGPCSSFEIKMKTYIFPQLNRELKKRINNNEK